MSLPIHLLFIFCIGNWKGGREKGRLEDDVGLTLWYSHYVAFIRKTIPDTGEEAWVLFNDEKVVKAEGDAEEMKKFAYVYFFERV